jgi:hypothetical protein
MVLIVDLSLLGFLRMARLKAGSCYLYRPAGGRQPVHVHLIGRLTRLFCSAGIGGLG